MNHPFRHLLLPVANPRGGAVGILVAVVLVLALAGGGGYWAYLKYLKKEPLKDKLAVIRMKPELIQFTHDTISPALYHNLVTADEIVAQMNREQARLNRIGKQFPNQMDIVAPQAEALGGSRDRLMSALTEVATTIEKIYVTWLVDHPEGVNQIRSQRGTLTRQLADAIRGESVLIGRIRSHPDNAS